MKIPFGLMFVKTFRARQAAIRPLMLDLGLSPGQPIVLEMLERNNNILQKDLASLCDIEPATISKLLVNLEESGLIRRSPVEGDRRAACISITDRGREVIHRFSDISAQVKEQSLRGFSPQEREQFQAYLTRMYANLTESGPGEE